MTVYRLAGGWSLRGWLNEPYCAVDLAGEREKPVRPLPYALFAALIKCDGKTPLGEDRRLAALLRHGLIEDGTAPLKPEQRYRVFPFNRRVYAQIGITGRCNFLCRHCFMAGDENSPEARHEFTADECGRILDELLACGVARVELTGGEPLLSQNFFTFAEGLARRHMRLTRLLTNGSLLTDETLSRLGALGCEPEVVLSFDGLASHDWMRGVSGAGELAIAALRRARERGLKVRCAVNVNARTLPELMDTCRFLSAEGASSLFLLLTSQTPRWKENAWNEQTLSDDDFFRSMDELARVAITENWGMALDVFNGFHLLPDGERVELKRQFDSNDPTEPAMCCNKGRNSFFIAHDGRVLPCDPFEGITLAGDIMHGDNNILTRPLEDILTSSCYSRLYDMPLSEIADNNPECAACEYLGRCRGGCRAYAYGASMAFGGGYKAGGGRLDYYAQPSCVYHKGGYSQINYSSRKES